MTTTADLQERYDLLQIGANRLRDLAVAAVKGSEAEMEALASFLFSTGDLDEPQVQLEVPFCTCGHSLYDHAVEAAVDPLKHDLHGECFVGGCGCGCWKRDQ